MSDPTSNVTAIFSGIVVFGDPMGDGALIIALRLAAFALVVAAAAMMPAPTRVGGGDTGEARGRPQQAARPPVGAVARG